MVAVLENFLLNKQVVVVLVVYAHQLALLVVEVALNQNYLLVQMLLTQ